MIRTRDEEPRETGRSRVRGGGEGAGRVCSIHSFEILLVVFPHAGGRHRTHAPLKVSYATGTGILVLRAGKGAGSFFLSPRSLYPRATGVQKEPCACDGFIVLGGFPCLGGFSSRCFVCVSCRWLLVWFLLPSSAFPGLCCGPSWSDTRWILSYIVCIATAKSWRHERGRWWSSFRPAPCGPPVAIEATWGV